MGGGEGGGGMAQVVSSSCHDVTIMALLAAMKSHLAVSTVSKIDHRVPGAKLLSTFRVK